MTHGACCRAQAATLAIVFGGLLVGCSGTETTATNESNRHDAGGGGSDGSSQDGTLPEASAHDSSIEGAAGSGGTTMDGSSDATDAAKDAIPDGTIVVDAGPDSACMNVGQLCSDTGRPCCAGAKCYSMAGTGLCLPEGSDGGQPDASCKQTLSQCTSPSECCPGLDCMDLALGFVCMTPLWDGGLPDSWLPQWDTGLSDNWLPQWDAPQTDGLLSCINVYESCSQGGWCCLGLTCKTDPPNGTESECLPLIAPDPDHCPDDQPSGPCIDLGLKCSYPPMTSCMCRFGGWQCAY